MSNGPAQVSKSLATELRGQLLLMRLGSLTRRSRSRFGGEEGGSACEGGKTCDCGVSDVS